VNGIPEYGTGRREDYLSQQDERAEQARDQAAGEVTREFAGWFEAQGYPSPDDRYDGEEMAEAFKSGMQAARDLAAAQEAHRHFTGEIIGELRQALGADPDAEQEAGEAPEDFAIRLAHYARERIDELHGLIAAQEPHAAPEPSFDVPPDGAVAIRPSDGATLVIAFGPEVNPGQAAKAVGQLRASGLDVIAVTDAAAVREWQPAPELAALHDQLASAKHALARLTSENPVKAQHEDFFEDEFLARVQYARNALASLPFVSPHEPGAAAS
jgi:hypothetical protein